MAKLSDIINIADQSYPDGLVGMAASGDKPGDSLAEFIATELKETFDEEMDTVLQIKEAMRAVDNAKQELQSVHQALSEALIQCKKVARSKHKDLPLLINTLTHPLAQTYLEERIKGED